MSQPMITALDPIEDSQLPVLYQPPPLPEVKLVFDEIKKSIAPPDASEAEIEAFIRIAEHLGLDPWKREIYFTKYAGKFSPTVGYQVCLARAERTRLLDGWQVEVDSDNKPTKAICTIWRKDWKHPFVWETLRAEVAYTYSKSGRTERALHKAQPVHALKKCCISRAFYVCFPTEFSGMPYIREELPLDQGYDQQEAKPPAPLDDWKAAYFASIKDIPEFAEEFFRRQFQLTHTNKSSVADMDKDDMAKLFDALDQSFPEGPDGKRHPLAAQSQEPEPQPETQPRSEPDSDSDTQDETVTLFSTAVQKFCEENDFDSKYLYLYLASRFILPALDEQAAHFLNRMKTNPGNIKALNDALLTFTKWANTVGTDELLGCVTDLHYYSSNLDEDAGANFLQQFFTAFGVRPDKGLYKIWDIPATAFGTWKFVVTSLAQKFGFPDEDEIDETEISDDEQIPEDVPEVDDDIPF